MKENDIQAFNLLKQKIVRQMQQSYPGINPSISEWKGQDIVDFQEELLEKVNAHISEKWFYNHLKSGRESLPRIDILNLLSKYVGYFNWADFRFKNLDHVVIADPVIQANRYFIYVPLAVLFVLSLFVLVFKIYSTREYEFCFYDADTRQPIVNTIIEANVLKNGESPVSYLCGADGCFKLKTDKANVRFLVKSPYYLTDTVIRILDKFNTNEIVQLRPDNYALMILYFSNRNVKDWKKRRDQLDKIISDSAMVYQVFSKEGIGVELYNKWEFIDKLTLPSRSLKDIEILDAKYLNDKISIIRFRQKEAYK